MKRKRLSLEHPNHLPTPEEMASAQAKLAKVRSDNKKYFQDHPVIGPETPDTCDRCHQPSTELSHAGRDGYDFLCPACVVLPPAPTENRIIRAWIGLTLTTGDWTANVLKQFAPEHGGGTQVFTEQCGTDMHRAIDVLRGMVTLAPGARTDITLPPFPVPSFLKDKK